MGDHSNLYKINSNNQQITCLALYFCFFFLLVTTKPTVPCGGEFAASSGNITSPNYPDEYPTNVYCSWDITVPNNQIQLHLLFYGVVCPDRLRVSIIYYTRTDVIRDPTPENIFAGRTWTFYVRYTLLFILSYLRRSLTLTICWCVLVVVCRIEVVFAMFAIVH